MGQCNQCKNWIGVGGIAQKDGRVLCVHCDGMSAAAPTDRTPAFGMLGGFPKTIPIERLVRELPPQASEVPSKIAEAASASPTLAVSAQPASISISDGSEPTPTAVSQPTTNEQKSPLDPIKRSRHVPKLTRQQKYSSALVLLLLAAAFGLPWVFPPETALSAWYGAAILFAMTLTLLLFYKGRPVWRSPAMIFAGLLFLEAVCCIGLGYLSRGKTSRMTLLEQRQLERQERTLEQQRRAEEVEARQRELAAEQQAFLDAQRQRAAEDAAFQRDLQLAAESRDKQLADEETSRLAQLEAELDRVRRLSIKPEDLKASAAAKEDEASRKELAETAQNAARPAAAPKPPDPIKLALNKVRSLEGNINSEKRMLELYTARIKQLEGSIAAMKARYMPYVQAGRLNEKQGEQIRIAYESQMEQLRQTQAQLSQVQSRHARLQQELVQARQEYDLARARNEPSTGNQHQTLSKPAANPGKIKTVILNDGTQIQARDILRVEGKTTILKPSGEVVSVRDSEIKSIR